MRLTVLGSGGALVTPRPGCACRVCVSARARPDEARAGPSVFVHDARLLIDAPEDVVWSLNRAGVERVDHLFITHWHPDHCAGLRVLETLTWDLNTSRGRSTVDVWLNAATQRRLKHDLGYFESKGYCRVHVVTPGETTSLGPLTARWFGYAEDEFLTGMVLSDARARVLVAMDETKHLWRDLEREEWAVGCDLAVLEAGWLTTDPLGAPLGPPDADFHRTEAGFERDTVPLVRALRPKRAILVHLNGDLMGRTPEELRALEAEHAPLPLEFARDGLTITA